MFLEKKTLHKIWLNPGLKLTAPFEQSVFIKGGSSGMGLVKYQGHPTTIFGKHLSVQKTIWDLEFSEHL